MLIKLCPSSNALQATLIIFFHARYVKLCYANLIKPSNALQAVLFQLCSSSYALQAMFFKLCSSSYALQAMLFNLCSSSYALQAMLFKLCSSSYDHLSCLHCHYPSFCLTQMNCPSCPLTCKAYLRKALHAHGRPHGRNPFLSCLSQLKRGCELRV